MKHDRKLMSILLVFFLAACGGGGGGEDGRIDFDGGAISGAAVIIPEELDDLKDKVLLAQAGEPVDFDGDGIEDFQRTSMDDGSFFVEMFRPNGDVYYQAEYSPDGAFTIYQDTDGDGKTDIVEVRTVAPFHEERLYDRNFDGYPEERLRAEHDESSRTLNIFLERDLDGDGDYDILSQQGTVIDAAEGQQSSKTKITRGEMYQGPVIIFWEGCGDTTEEAHRNGLRIAAAAECALGHGVRCLHERSTRFYNKIIDRMAGGKTIRIGCGIPEGKDKKNIVAWTQIDDIIGQLITHLNEFPNIYFNKMALADGLLGCGEYNAKCLAEGEDERLCNVFLHEFLHYVEWLVDPDHDKTGQDELYSCARYCGGCASNLLGATGNPHVDCLLCGGTPQEKMTCGYVEKIEETNCDQSISSAGICHSGLACVAGPCEICHELVTQTCDEEILKGNPDIHAELINKQSLQIEDFLCCAQCSEGCDSSNDFPCNMTENVQNTCHDPLPMCNIMRAAR